MDYVLRTEELSKQYADCHAVNKVSVTVGKGDIYGLIGENGAGKSTLMKMIAGLVEPTEGVIELFGTTKAQEERYRIGCVIESPALYEELTAEQNMEVFRRAYGLANQENIHQILEMMRLGEASKKQVRKFSLGMKQRLAIGIALLGNPDFLILDEPINGLDPTGIQEMRNLILTLNREKRITIMISSHILSELSKVATKYGIMKNGRLIDEITEKDIATKCQCCLKLKVSDAVKGAMLIENRLHSTSYEVVEDNVLRVFEYVDNPNVINSLFVQEGIQVYECSVSQESLEDYFNEKIQGGNRND